MNKTQYIFLDIPTVKKLIVEKGPKDNYRKDELVTASLLAGFCEKLWGTQCDIGFPIKDSETKTIPAYGISDIPEIKEILNKKTQQSHDVDAVVVEHTPESAKRSGQSFQIKCFDSHQADMSTDGLIRYIDGLVYTKTETALVILLATGHPTQFTKVHKSVNFEKFPFSALYFLGLYQDILKLIEVWPNLGKEEIQWDSA